jgi:succinate-semialdehyde dehydrogenase/glutarate-semialdehyde dehydrogenase
MAIQSINPATGEMLASYPEASAEEVSVRLERAEEAYQAWCRVGIGGRARRFREAADMLRKRREPYARLMAQEMGKPVTQVPKRSRQTQCGASLPTNPWA